LLLSGESRKRAILLSSFWRWEEVLREEGLGKFGNPRHCGHLPLSLGPGS